MTRWIIIFDVAPISLILGGVFKDFVIFTSKIWGKFYPNVDVSIEVVENHLGIDSSTPFRPIQGAPGCLASFLRSAQLVQAIWGLATRQVRQQVWLRVEINHKSQIQNQPKPTEALAHQCSKIAVSIFCASRFCSLCRRVISVSRLDRETSGVLVAATCQEGADALTEQFKEHRVFKRYLALCTGRLEPPEGKGG